MLKAPRSLTGAAFILVVLLLSCQTPPKPTGTATTLVKPAASSIATESLGFSPKAAIERGSIDFSLTIGNPEAVKSWKVELRSDKAAAKTFSGTGKVIPQTLSWDGRDDSGSLATEGRYIAHLAVEYANTYESATAASSSFVLDITPPSGRLILTPTDLVPTATGLQSPASIEVEANSVLAKIDSWSLDILDSSGKVFWSFSEKWTNRVATWNGLSSGGVAALPLTSYKAVARVRDEYGNEGEISLPIPMGDLSSVSGSTLIEPRSAGFAPRGETAAKTMEFNLAIDQRSAVRSWKIVIAHAEREEQRNFSGDSGNLPTSLSWDGLADSGFLAMEGSYTASLYLDYGTAFKPVSVKSKPFVLDVTPPSGTIVADPPSLSPDGKGGIAAMTLSIVANSDLAPLDTWTLKIAGDGGATILSADGRFPGNSFSWDGRSSDGTLVDPTKPYRLEARVTDVFGNAGILTGALGLVETPKGSALVSIVPKSRGFSPNGDGAMDGMELDLGYGQPRSVKSWKVEIQKSGQTVQTISGTALTLPAAIAWDGTKADGRLADEGSYSATLSVDYGSVFNPASAKSEAFVLDLRAPQGEIVLSPPLFSPIEGNTSLGITVKATSVNAKMDSWSMKIYDPAGNLFKSFEGKWPDTRVEWDGKSIEGDLVESAEDYPVTATVRDEFGNSSQLKSMIPVDVLVEKLPRGYRILSSRIFFKAFEADYIGVSADLAAQNTQRLNDLAAKLKKFPGYRIRLVGHAVMINWDDPARGRIEQNEVLIPLGLARAEAIKKAMIKRGLDPRMISTEGVGGVDQLVPDSDLVNRWRNRRVAFYLEKP